MSVVVDPIDGHPVSVSIDWQANAIDDEKCYEITNYLPAPWGLSATRHQMHLGQ